MKKLLDVVMVTLAINFVLAAVAVTYLFQSGKLDREKVGKIKELVMATSQPSTQPAEAADAGAATQPALRLEELLAKQAGQGGATEQVQFIQRTFDAQMAVMDRRQRELSDLQKQVELAKLQMAKDRAALEAEKKTLEQRESESTRLATDKGFQDTLELYKSMPAKQTKDVFMGLDDDTVVRFVQAMEPKQASKILKEFKTDEEKARVAKVLEKLRQSQASVKE